MAITPVGFTGTVTEVEFSKMMNAVGAHGVIGSFGGSSLAGTRVPGARNMLIQPGECYAPGVHVSMDAAASAAVAAPANTSGYSRIDLMVMRINWTTHAAALIMIAGTPGSDPQPPAYNQVPGVVYDVPLRQGTLPHSAADYSETTIAQGDRRTWLVDGIMSQPDDGVLPTNSHGRLVTLPEDGRILLGGFGSERWTFTADHDSGWETVSLAAPGGFSGSVKGRIRNKVASIQFNWTKIGGTATNADFAVTFPAQWWPSGIDISRGVWAGNSPVRVYFSAINGQMAFNNVTISPGNILGGGFTYFVN